METEVKLVTVQKCDDGIWVCFGKNLLVHADKLTAGEIMKKAFKEWLEDTTFRKSILGYRKKPVDLSDNPMDDSGGNFDDAYSMGMLKGEVDGFNEAIDVIANLFGVEADALPKKDKL